MVSLIKILFVASALIGKYFEHLLYFVIYLFLNAVDMI